MNSTYNPGSGIPNPSVLQGSDGQLYGTTPAGGQLGQGTVFKLNPNGTGYTIIHDFSNGTPGGLIQGADGSLYGAGTSAIFKLDPSGSNYTVLHTLTNDTDGNGVLGTLLQASDGTLYGTTIIGGTNGNGTVFAINTNDAGFNVLHAFGPGEGAFSSAGLIQGSDGALYGTTSSTNLSPLEGGIIFKINTDGGNFRVLHTFTGAPNDGSAPLAPLVEGSPGVLYGTTLAGAPVKGNIAGSVFKIGLDGSSYATLYFFTTTQPAGTEPASGLVKDPSPGNPGVFYGTTTGFSTRKDSVFAMLANPPLSITPVTGQTVSNQTVLFWPKWAGSYSLQSTTNVASSNWVNVTDALPVYGAQVTSTNPTVFYRLVSP